MLDGPVIDAANLVMTWVVGSIRPIVLRSAVVGEPQRTVRTGGDTRRVGDARVGVFGDGVARGVDPSDRIVADVGEPQRAVGPGRDPLRLLDRAVGVMRDGMRRGIDAADRRVEVREPQRAVGSGRDITGAEGVARIREVAERSGRGDPADGVGVRVEEPQRAVGTRGDAAGGREPSIRIEGNRRARGVGGQRRADATNGAAIATVTNSGPDPTTKIQVCPRVAARRHVRCRVQSLGRARQPCQ